MILLSLEKSAGGVEQQDKQNRNKMIQQKIKAILNHPLFEKSILSMIFLNLIVFVLQTDANIYDKIGNLFNIFEFFSIIIFTIEYLARTSCIKNIKELFSPMMIIDFCAIIPFYISFISINTIALRTLRLFRLFRLAKFARYSKALENIKNAFIKRKNELIMTVLIFGVAVFISSTLIYYAEHNTGQEAFKSIVSSSWWAIITFTTVGYGDAYPITTCGKIIGSLTAIFGVGLHGLLIGVISSALMGIIKNGDLKSQETPEADFVKLEKLDNKYRR